MHERELRATSFLLQEIKNNDLIRVGIERLLIEEYNLRLNDLCDAFGKAVEAVIYTEHPRVDIPIIQDLRLEVIKDF